MSVVRLLHSQKMKLNKGTTSSEQNWQVTDIWEFETEEGGGTVKRKGGR